MKWKQTHCNRKLKKEKEIYACMYYIGEVICFDFQTFPYQYQSTNAATFSFWSCLTLGFKCVYNTHSIVKNHK